MKYFFAIIGLACLFAGCGRQHSGYDRLLRSPDVLFYHVPVGLCEDYPEETTTLKIIRKDMEFLRHSGIDLLRISFGWDAIESERDQYDWHFWDDYVRMAVEEYGITLIPYVCYTPQWNSTGAQDTLNFWSYPPVDYEQFGVFMRALVSRYSRWIKSWELWNEPDISAYWRGSAADLARLVRIGSNAVRETDPEAIVVLPGLAHRTEFTRELFRDHGISPFVDVVNIHNYFETWHPSPVEAIADYVDEIAAIVHDYGDHQSIWMAEVGYSTWRVGARVSDHYQAYYDYEHTLDYQAIDLFKRLSLVAATNKMAAIAWYELKDLPQVEDVIGDNNNRNLGVAYLDHAAKPAAGALMFFNSLFSQPYRGITTELTMRRQPESDSHVVGFENEDGSVILVAWLRTADVQKRGDDVSGEVKDLRQEKIDIVIPRALSGTATLYTELGDATAYEQVERSAAETLVRDLTLEGGKIAILHIQ
ncbi:cellulase family glycosylhydrolase [candidate division KSB1 bacterium]|nr:cellulase family glycosylhydrolase [candidate division KSB1 bacterium]